MQHSANTIRLQKLKTRNNQILNPYIGTNFSSSPNEFHPGQLPINQKYINDIGKINDVPVLQYQRTSHLPVKNNNLEMKHFQNRKHQQFFVKHSQHHNHSNSNFRQATQIRNSFEKKINRDQQNVSDKYLSKTIPIYKNSEVSFTDKLNSKIAQENAQCNNSKSFSNIEYKTNLSKQNMDSMSRNIQSNTQTIEEERKSSNDVLIANVPNEETQKNYKLCNVEISEMKIKDNTEENRNDENENQEINLNIENFDVHTEDVIEKAVKSTREKTPMCLINDLARYNKISFQYRLTSEKGPAHCKRFTVTLKLGDEEYTAEGFKIKKAQHLAAKEAIEKTKYKHPVPKLNRNDDNNVVKSNITPTVELNALAMKLGQPTYYIFDPNQMDYHEKKCQSDITKSNLKLTCQTYETTRPIQQPTVETCSVFLSNLSTNSKQFQTLNQRQSFFSKYQSSYLPMYSNGQATNMNSMVSTYFSPAAPCKITLIVGTSKFEGIGRTLQQAKHNAASNALQVLKQKINSGRKDDSHNEISEDNDNKSPISLVFEIGIKRNLPVDFKVLREEGPAHMRTFITACIVGDLMTEGEGTGKKISKKRAAQKMLDELNKLPPILPNVSPMKKPKLKIAPKKCAVAQTKALNLVESKEITDKCNKNKKHNYETDSGSPITKLLEWHQNRKEQEPLFKLISECGKENSRRRQFVMEVSSNNIVAHGVGHNKKMAKRDAAQNFLNALNENNQMLTRGESHKCTSKSNTLPCIQKQDEVINNLELDETNRKHEKNKESIDFINCSSFQDLSKDSPSSSILDNTSSKSQSRHMKDQLLYLAKLLGFEVEFSDYPKGNHNEFLTIVMLSTNPPQICHGVGINSKDSQEDAAKNALKILSEMGLNNAVKT